MHIHAYFQIWYSKPLTTFFLLLASPTKKKTDKQTNKQKERWQGHRNSCGQLQRARNIKRFLETRETTVLTRIGKFYLWFEQRLIWTKIHTTWHCLYQMIGLISIVKRVRDGGVSWMRSQYCWSRALNLS